MLLLAVATMLLDAVSAVTPRAVLTSNDTSYQLKNYTAPVLNNSSPGNLQAWDLYFNDTAASGRKQTIQGFGAAVTDATVSVFGNLTKTSKTSFLNDLFNSSTGINFNLMRHTIGSSDLSSSVYSYDENNYQQDTSLARFSSTNLTSAGQAMVSLLAQIKTMNVNAMILGSMWSPPSWMKNNTSLYGYGTLLQNTTIYSSYALYLVDYLQLFAREGVYISAITLQNEPLNDQPTFPTMLMYSDLQTNLINNYIIPAFTQHSVTTQIWGYDHNTDNTSYPQAVFTNAPNVSSIAWHCYAANNDWGVLSAFQATNTNNPTNNPNGKVLQQFMTECWTPPWSVLGDNGWANIVDFFMGPLQNWASGSMAWTLATDTNYGPRLPYGCSQCSGIILVNTAAGTYIKTPSYYFLGQFSKFLARGSSVLYSTGSYDWGNGTKVEAVAVINTDGSRTMVVHNTYPYTLYLRVHFNSGELWSGPVYPLSVMTWILPSTTGNK